MTTVDVIVPCYNYGRFLTQCVESVLSQEGVEVRVLIIDDASTDNSSSIAKQFCTQDNRVECIVNKKNHGHIINYNKGIEWAAARYMLILSADDFIAPGALHRAVSAMDNDMNVGMIYGRAIRFREQSEAIHFSPYDINNSVTKIVGSDFIRRLCHVPMNPVDTATAVVRTDLQKKIGNYRAELPHSGDLEMWLRFAAHSDVGELNCIQAYTRLHGENMRNNYDANMFIGDYWQKYEAFKLFFTYCYLDKSGRDLQKLAYRNLSVDAVWKASIAFEKKQISSVASLLAFSKSIHPNIIISGVWWKLAIKRLVGSSLSDKATSFIKGRQGETTNRTSC